MKWNKGPARTEAAKSSKLLLVYRALLLVVLALLVLLAAGTIYGLLRQNIPVSGVQAAGSEDGAEGIFSNIGKLRIATAGSESETVIISVAFPYNQNDRAFAEELASRLGEFKSLTVEYLGAFTADQLMSLEVSAIKGDLLERYNALLKLGRINDLYISDFIRL
ncbi:MAG: flagellar basal body protein FliL [Treponema sp.]|jgi:flagellar basal body-associated protein FliL|nr:flagellar basal body protein FliL [Treponema sp.]